MCKTEKPPEEQPEKTVPVKLQRQKGTNRQAQQLKPAGLIYLHKNLDD